jgi:D-aminoacyl-tRNA deacylase
MSFSCIDVRGDILIVPQFILLGDCSCGRRPVFDKVADPGTALDLYEYYVESLCKSGLKVNTGEFGEGMKPQLVNDGPATFLL